MNTQPTHSIVAQYAVTTLLTLTVAVLITGVALLLISKIGITGSALFGSGAGTLVLTLGIWSCYMISKSADGLQRPAPRLNTVLVGGLEQQRIATNNRAQELESQINSLPGNQDEQLDLLNQISQINQYENQIMQLQHALTQEQNLKNQIMIQRDALQQNLTNIQTELFVAHESNLGHLEVMDSLKQELNRLRQAEMVYQEQIKKLSLQIGQQAFKPIQDHTRARSESPPARRHDIFSPVPKIESHSGPPHAGYGANLHRLNSKL